MKTAAAFDLCEESQARQEDLADFQRRLRILEAVADRIPYTWYVYDVIADRCVWSGAGPGGEPTAPEQVAQSDLHPDDGEVLADRRQRIAQMRDGEAIGTTYRVCVAGEWRWYRVRDTVLSRDEHGVPQQVLSLLQDITTGQARTADYHALREAPGQAGAVVCERSEPGERLARSDAGRAQREIYQKVLDFVPVGAALFDRALQGRLIWANRAYWRQLGQSQPADDFAAELAVQHFADFFDVHDAAGQPLPPSKWPLARALRGEHFYSYEVCLRHRITDRRWFVSFDALPFADPAGAHHLALLVLHPAQATSQTQRGVRPDEHAVAVVPAEFMADITDLSVPRLDPAMLAREFGRAQCGPITPEPDRPDALSGLQVVYVAGPGDSLEPDCPGL